MQAARRIYLYLMTGIGLGALVAGLTMLLGVLLRELGLGPTGGVVSGGDEAVRQQLTVAAALIVVSLPVWLIHWFVAERGVRPERPGGLLELNAPERGLYFALALGALLAVGASGLASAIEGAILRVADADVGYRDVAGDLGRAAVAIGFWGYHIRLRGRDWERRVLTHQAAFLPRAYRYVAAFIGLMVMLFAVTGLVELVGRLVLDEPVPMFDEGGVWWAYPLATGISGVVVGAAVWIGHWAHAARLVADPGPRGESERSSRLRLAFHVAVLVTTGATALLQLGLGVGAGIREALGVAETTGAGQALGAVVVPILNAIVFAIAWWVHARWLEREPMALATPTGGDTVHRLRQYPLALVGLAFGATGAAWMIGLVIDALFGGIVISGDLWRRQLADTAPFAALGWVVWIACWAAVARRTAGDPIGEAASTIRRTTMLIVLAASVLAGIGAAGVILYRLFGSLFGIRLTGDPISELSLPIGILLVALVLGLAHGTLLRRDARVRSELEEAAPAQPAARSVRLRLTGPADQMERALAALGGATPTGYALELEPDDAATAPG